MKIFSFFAKTKIETLSKSLTQQLAEFDPQGMSDAGMALMEDELNNYCKQTETARADYNKEFKEYVAMQQLFDQRVTAAESISAQVDSATDEAHKAQLSASLSKLLDTIEKLSADVEREKTEADEAKATLDDLEAISKDLAEQMKTARTRFNDAQREIKSATAQKARADLAADRAAQASGLRSNASSVNVALDAMQQSAADLRASAEASKRKAELLKPTQVEQDDPIIAAELAKVNGSAVNETFSERIARLKSK
jgi:chromosome segregation ATPase